jgi:penicillin amidase
MKATFFLLSLIVTVALIVVLNTSFDKIPAFGPFLSPQHGFWQNAEPVEHNTNEIRIPGLDAETVVYFDNRMVPHIFAEDEKNAYFAQGYLHARYRLWQMEFQTIAASGRLSGVLGAGTDSAYLNNDRRMRRMGMVYGAERSLQFMLRDDETRNNLEAYTAGVNSYIDRLTVSQLPLEYRLLGYLPERWTNLKTALLLMYLSLDLTGSDSDIEFSNARSFFTKDDFDKLYPLIHDSADPVIPRGTPFPPPSIPVKIPDGADSLYYNWMPQANVFPVDPEKDNGSNNWAVGGSKTQSGRPILCNDPHLGLNLPSLWYEVQISTPVFNVYGASLPGSPAVVIGFNDSIAWGVTNAARDVLDYYSIRFKDGSMDEYFFNKRWVKAEKKVEKYELKGGGVFYDTVAYTIMGPVIFDEHYNGKGRTDTGMNLAIRWKAHDPANPFKTFNLLNKAKSYTDYEEAISHFNCPGQNFVFASKSGDIAMWQQGKFPAKWYRQGDFIMPGEDSTYFWRGDIPRDENPHHVNPARGFVSSANQIPADTSYPYYLNTDYDVYRGVAINGFLNAMQNITVDDMRRLQNENYNAFAADALPFLLEKADTGVLTMQEKKYFSLVSSWNKRNDPHESGPTIFNLWIDALDQLVWGDEFAKIAAPTERPGAVTLLEQLRKDSAFAFVDDVSTDQKETLRGVITAAFKKACTTIMYTERDGRLQWGRFKDAGIRHLLRMEQLSRYHLSTGGGVHVINATKQFHGPSWKMVVHLTDEIEAYGIYPGGQNGNPGSREYDEFVDDWAAGKYYRLWIMKKTESNDRRVRSALKFYKPNR